MPLAARRALALLATCAALPAIAAAPAAADASSCSTPTLTQPFSSWGDLNWYVLAPGQSLGNFDGNGWTLGNGARLVTATVLAGARATVLQLPSGGWAMSPAMCVDPTFQSARLLARSVTGSPDIEAWVSYQYPWGWSQYQGMGQSDTSNSWRPSDTFSLGPPAIGWQMARFVLRAGGPYSAAQVYDFFVDPYSRG